MYLSNIVLSLCLLLFQVPQRSRREFVPPPRFATPAQQPMIPIQQEPDPNTLGVLIEVGSGVGMLWLFGKLLRRKPPPKKKRRRRIESKTVVYEDDDD